MEYKTLTDVMNMKGREAAPIVARIAPALAKVAKRSGVVGLLFNPTVATATSETAMARLTAKERASVEAKMADIGQEVTLKLLEVCLGECLADMVEIVAAVNGTTADQLLDDCTTAEIVARVKAIASDPGFFGSLASLTR